MKSLNLLEVGYYCITIMREGGKKNLNLKYIYTYIKTSFHTKNHFSKPIGVNMTYR